VFEAEHVTHHFGGKLIVRDFSVRVMRGDRIGIIGPNGVGKSVGSSASWRSCRADRGARSRAGPVAGAGQRSGVYKKPMWKLCRRWSACKPGPELERCDERWQALER
jgi:ABC-type dipeptide/oligopeptide/nickel transport system ATPase subunit